jgi:hypothetical protein
MLKEALIEILFGAAILLSGALIYFLGNLIFGFQQSGGKRLIVFIVGAVCVLGSVFVFVMASKEETVWNGLILLMLLAGVFGIFGLYATWKSFFASSEAIDKLFDAMLGGL